MALRDPYRPERLYYQLNLDMSTAPAGGPSAHAHEDLTRLWEEALRKYYEDTGTGAEIASSKFVEELIACDNAEAVSAIVDSHTKEFKQFRKYGGKTKDFLKRAVPILKKFTDVTADATSVSSPSLHQTPSFDILIFRIITGDNTR